MRVSIVRNFLTAAECASMTTAAFDGVDAGWVKAGISRAALTQTRLTSRMYSAHVTLPANVLDVERRVAKTCQIKGRPRILGHGSGGTVVSITLPGGDVYEHQDPRSLGGLATLRCNIVTQMPEVGGVLHVGGQPIDVGLGDLHCYLASEHAHFVTEVEGATPRVLWMFGAHVPANDWDEERIGPC